jgi:hypothetical protein
MVPPAAVAAAAGPRRLTGTVLDVSLGTMSTAGGQTVTINLSNVALAGNDTVQAWCQNQAGTVFGPSPTCTVVTATQVRCSTLAGVGAGVSWRISVNGVTGPLSSASLNAYARPTITGQGCVCVTCEGWPGLGRGWREKGRGRAAVALCALSWRCPMWHVRCAHVAGPSCPC